MTAVGIGGCVTALGVSISNKLMLAGLIIAVGGMLIARRNPFRHPSCAWLLAGTAWALWSTTVVMLPVMGTDRWFAHVHGSWYAWLIMPAVTFVARDPCWRRRICTCLAYGVAISALLAIIQFTVGYDRTLRPLRINATARIGGRASGFFGVHLTQAFVMGCALLVVLQHDRHWGLGRWAGWIARIGATLAVLMTQARSVVVALVAGVTAAAILRDRRRMLVATGGSILLMATATLGIWLVQPDLISQLARHSDSRRYIWQVSGKIALDHLLLGVGSKDAFRAEYRHYLQQDRPETFVTIDPDTPEGMLQRHPEVLVHRDLVEALSRYHDLTAFSQPTSEQMALRKKYRIEIISMFNHLTGKAALFPQGAPHAHSSLLTLAAFHGLPAMLFYLLAFASIILFAWRHRIESPQAAALTLAVVVYAFIAGLFEDVAGDTESTYAIFLALGLATALRQPAGDSGSITPPPLTTTATAR